MTLFNRIVFRSKGIVPNLPRILAVLALFFAIEGIFSSVVGKGSLLLPTDRLFVTMKPFTSILGLIFAVILSLYSPRTGSNKIIKKKFLELLNFFSLMLVGIILFGALFKLNNSSILHFGIVNKELHSFNSVAPGIPSLSTLLSSLALSVVALIREYRAIIFFKVCSFFNLFVFLTGVLALIGYQFDFPLLYGMIKGVSTAMNPITAVMLICLSVGFLIADIWSYD